MSVHRRKDSPFWQVDITVAGRRIRRSSQATTRRAAEAVEQRIRNEALAGSDVERPTLTVAEAFGRYWLEHAADLPSAHVIEYQGDAIQAALGRETKLTDLSDAVISEMVAAFRGGKHSRKPREEEKKKDPRPMGPGTINRHLTLLRSVINRCRRRWKLAVPDIDWQEHWRSEPEPRDRYLTTEEAARLLDECIDYLAPVVEMALLTGLRKRDIVGLDWRQVDFHEREIRVLVKGRKGQPKRLVLPITPPLLVLLSGLDPRDEGIVFQAPEGGRLGSFRTAFAAACRRAGIQGADDGSPFRFHDLRHTAGSWMAKEGIPLDVVKKVLGHADIRTTERYVHRDTKEMARAMDTLGARLQGRVTNTTRKQEKAS